MFHAVHDAFEPARTFTAWRALSTRLTGEELGNTPGCANDAAVFVEHHNGSRTEHRCLFRYFVLTEGNIELLGGEPRSGNATRYESLDLLVTDDATTERGIKNDVAEGVLHHFEFIHAGVFHTTGESKESSAGRATLAERGECGAAVVDDPRHVGHRLNVVDDRGLTVEANGGWEVWRLDTGEPALAFECFDQRRLFAANVGTGTGVNNDVERET